MGNPANQFLDIIISNNPKIIMMIEKIRKLISIFEKNFLYCGLILFQFFSSSCSFNKNSP
ncbi:MAG: hypothetical protein KJ623_04240 [Nanoarchaeota archaeon]|nr:hypothetical protein [Nanoarchaeota archaeon]MBU0962575.1 hypothetical protein [Nanoarchaeota archaeon]